jgi:ATP-dependent RNA helicase MSS116, mitochondrial
MAQRAITENPSLGERSTRRVRSDDICGIIISPTRELAEQIGVEAKRLTARTGLKVQLAVGGTQKNAMLRSARYEGCHLLIGTPGRIQDLLADEYSGIKAPRLNTLVLDEADRLLDVGFGPAIEDIKAMLPDPRVRPRQNMLFSATISQEVVGLVRHTLQPGFKFVQCVDPNAEPTHTNVPQRLALLPGFENRMPALTELIDRELEKSASGASRPFKAMVFYNSTVETQFVHDCLQSHYKNLQILQIHGQLTQSMRTSASDAFRRCESGVLITTDVTARGLDFPNVTHILQMGVPVQNPRESYIHRLGRTARAGKEGEGWLFVTDVEAGMAKKHLLGLPLQRDETLQTIQVDLTETPTVPAHVEHHFENAKNMSRRVRSDVKRDVYINALRNIRNADKRDVINRANFWAKIEWNFDPPPGISPKAAENLGVRAHDGVNIEANADRQSRGFGNRGQSSRDRGGFGGQDAFNRRGSDSYNRGSGDSFNRRPRDSYGRGNRDPFSRG